MDLSLQNGICFTRRRSFIRVFCTWDFLCSGCSFLALVLNESSLLYFLSDYESWLEAKHTGFGPILFCYAVVDSYIGRRDMFRILLPWLLAPIVPMILHRVSILSLASGSLFGLLLTRGGLGKTILPGRDYLLRAQDSWTGRTLSSMWTSFCPAWSETAASPFVQSSEGSMFSDLHPTYENMRLLPMSSKESGRPSSGALSPAASAV